MDHEIRTYAVTEPTTLFVAGQRVDNGQVRLTAEAARYDLLAGVIVEAPAVEERSKARRTAIEG
jgi:hypothetical protein